MDDLPSHNWEIRMIVLVILAFLIIGFYEQGKVEKPKNDESLKHM